MSAEYRDDLTLPAAMTNMWSQVLLQAVRDATTRNPSAPSSSLRREIESARNYLTKPNADFNEVCYLAGLDPQAVRQRAIKLIAAAPSIDQLAGTETVH
ncbi:hypothetical protein J2W99_005095 [Bosea robiniae]|uniref:hypothetical protein n=1 Tax=Bosea TaxID=85413 RepID=UPI00285D17FC|nr:MULTISPECIES: hypothetical protein [Bosea]MDR6831342.1 hypothetical protein [Bosea robiniae]MDR6898090.1 hypothetical protein [Bosea sp. BE109]MDR7141479.1 hypothetical protein [Bosea sp. BE168]